MTADTLLIGAGDLGTEIGLRLAGAGQNVVAMRRRPELVPAPLVGLGGDVADGLPEALPEFAGAGGGPRHLVICLTAGGRDESAYEAVFLDGVAAVLRDVAARGWTPERALFVSSTSVCASSGVVDEAVAAQPETATARVLLAAENQFLRGLPSGTCGIVVRPSGIYGPGREWFIEQVRRGEVKDPTRMTHRVHRDDLARAIVHLLTMPQSPEELYLVTDDAPAPAWQVAEAVAVELGVARPESASTSDTAPPAAETRRLVNARLRETGFTFTYPSYREGYAAVIRGAGERHP